MNDIKFYGEKFKAFYRRARWTTTALAKRCGISRQCIVYWENGKIVPNEGKIRMLASILEIKVSDISNIEESIPISEKNMSSIVNAWSLIAKSTEQSRLAKIELFIKQIYAHHYEQEQIYLLTKALLDSMHSILYIKDKTLKYSIANKAFLDNLSLNPEYNVRGKTDFDFFPRKEAEKNQKEDFNVFNTGKEVINSEHSIYGSKKKKIGLVSKYPIMDEQKRIIGVLGNIVDISEQKKFEIIQNLITEALEQLDITVSITSVSKHYVIYYTGSIENVFGIDKNLNGEAAQEYFLTEIVHPDDREEQRKYYESSNFPPVREYRIIHPRKGIRTIRAITYISRKGSKNYSVALSIDVTQDKQK